MLKFVWMGTIWRLPIFFQLIFCVWLNKENTFVLLKFVWMGTIWRLPMGHKSPFQTPTLKTDAPPRARTSTNRLCLSTLYTIQKTTSGKDTNTGENPCFTNAGKNQGAKNRLHVPTRHIKVRFK